MVEMAGKKELTLADKFTLKIIRPLKNVFRDLLRYWTGRVGIAIILFLVATSIYAALALPAGFICEMGGMRLTGMKTRSGLPPHGFQCSESR